MHRGCVTGGFVVLWGVSAARGSPSQWNHSPFYVRTRKALRWMALKAPMYRSFSRSATMSLSLYYPLTPCFDSEEGQHSISLPIIRAHSHEDTTSERCTTHSRYFFHSASRWCGLHEWGLPDTLCLLRSGAYTETVSAVHWEPWWVLSRAPSHFHFTLRFALPSFSITIIIIMTI